MVLLSILILRINNTFLTTGSVMNNTKFGLLATSIAMSQMEEITNKAFDQKTCTSSANTTGDLTKVDSLGRDPGEVYPNFNDIDDYNGYTKEDSTMPSAVFDISCSVVYVKENNLDVASTSRTWDKKITVTVSSKSMEDTVSISSISSYWVFR